MSGALFDTGRRMSGSEWATAGVVVALWLGAGIPLAWRTVRAMRRHSRKSAPTEYLCPAPIRGAVCLGQLPCAEHGIADSAIGMAMYGDAYLSVPAERKRT